MLYGGREVIAGEEWLNHFLFSKSKVFITGMRVPFMTVIEISNTDTMKVLHYAFGEKDFETITIIAEQHKFKIIGMDRSSGIAAQVQLRLPRLTYSFDSQLRIPVITRDFNNCLGCPTSSYVPSDMPAESIRLTMLDTTVSIFMAFESGWSFQENLHYAEEGIESLPLLPSFDQQPSCTVTKAQLLKLCHLQFKDNERIFLQINGDRIVFNSPSRNRIFGLNGEGTGTASTALTPYALEVVSRVCELGSLNTLRMSISPGGLTQFYYVFGDGTLEYVVTSAAEEQL